jgi:hypothetical protein
MSMRPNGELVAMGLQILHEDGHPTCDMKFVAEDVNNRLLMWGQFENRGDHGHYLIELDETGQVSSINEDSLIDSRLFTS